MKSNMSASRKFEEAAKGCGSLVTCLSKTMVQKGIRCISKHMQRVIVNKIGEKIGDET